MAPLPVSLLNILFTLAVLFEFPPILFPFLSNLASLYEEVLLDTDFRSSPPIAIDESPVDSVFAPIAIDWSPFAQAPSWACIPLPIAIPCAAWVPPCTPTLVFAPIVTFAKEAPVVVFWAPALYPIATPKWFEEDNSPTLTLPSALALFPIATPFDVTAGTPPDAETALALAPTATESLSTLDPWPHATELLFPPVPALFPAP